MLLDVGCFVNYDVGMDVIKRMFSFFVLFVVGVGYFFSAQDAVSLGVSRKLCKWIFINQQRKTATHLKGAMQFF